MYFPENISKQLQHDLKKMWIENLTRAVIDHEERVKNMEETVKNYKDKIAITKKHIQEYKALIKDAEETVI
jgi:peptidoglycan hydrolase CwlO-like protein